MNTLKQLEVSEAVIAELVGHRNDSSTLSRCGKRYNLPLLIKAIQSLETALRRHLFWPAIGWKMTTIIMKLLDMCLWRRLIYTKMYSKVNMVK